jgi:hypothetical protein
MTEETRVGYKTTAILEEMCRNYIVVHTIDGRYNGDVKYLVDYNNLRDYNSQ